MCGINGIYSFNKQLVDRARLQTMANVMVHRGPDDDGVEIDNFVGIGFRRLAIIDQSGANQPLFNENNRLMLVCNGEIYNYKDLREDLMTKGHEFRTNGDAETILHLYEEYGVDCVDHVQGMFSFILWDSEHELFFAARDHFGIKPFYYWYDDEKLICSSELKSVLGEFTGPAKLNEQSLLHFLSFQYVPEPATMVEGVYKLPAGHRLIVKGNDFKIERYWKPVFDPIEEPDEQVRKKIRKALTKSVELHSQSDVPIGSFLSSGIDSTAIAAMLRKMGPLKTFSVGFEGGLNECEVARKTAEILDTDHHEWTLSEEDFFQAVESAVWHQDDPVADPSAIPLYLLSKMASRHVKVVLSGEGADEFFGGYRIYQEPQALKYFQWLPPSIKRAWKKHSRQFPDFFGKNYLNRAMTLLENRFIGNAKIYTEDVLDVVHENLKERYLHNETAFQLVKPFYEGAKNMDDVTKMQIIDTNFWLPGNILAKADKMSMAHSLELRVPFVDQSVFEVGRKISLPGKVNRKTTKRIFREAMSGIVPDHVLHRRKLGFPVPLRNWLKGERGEKCLYFILESGLSQYLNERYVDKLFWEHQMDKADHSRKIWCLYILAQWHVLYIENEKKSYSYLDGAS
ncbi:asparagine synthase (glutamine-hydrolyzing) [Salipaludibacillus daqingensis]|uniref:asparagine synthase (glutamine-hydrolyzing) n=1 Tax=Salipaludibacillus daqingensis TaxID=3041001 RepID=UPI0024749C39|nr:asparagine synthase (glutamine-hydrolyzing) [Salipaludibacillus daqingensis]